MENILKVFLMAFPEWLACIFMVVGLVVTALAAVRLGYGLVVAKTVYKWIVNAEEKFGSGAGAEKKAHVIAVLRGYTPDWLDWAINERTLDWIVQKGNVQSVESLRIDNGTPYNLRLKRK